MAWIFVVLVIAGFAALAFVWHMVSIEKEDTSGAVVARVEKVLPLQSIKIVIVAWQIVTQVSARAMQHQRRHQNTFAFHLRFSSRLLHLFAPAAIDTTNHTDVSHSSSTHLTGVFSIAHEVHMLPQEVECFSRPLPSMFVSSTRIFAPTAATLPRECSNRHNAQAPPATVRWLVRVGL